jgi:DNA-binding beta-propeller fold protein YncE
MLGRRARVFGGLALALLVAPGAAHAAVSLGPTASAYVTNEGSGTVAQYAVWLGGALTPYVPPTLSDAGLPFGPEKTVDGIPQDIVLSPVRRTAYVADWYGVEQYTIGARGTLTPKTPPFLMTDLSGALGSPFITGSVAVTPSGGNVYVGSGGSMTGAITEYTAAADGSLSHPASVMTPAGDYPNFLTVSPGGHSLYASTSDSSNGVLEYSIAANGSLTPKGQVVNTGSSPTGALVLSPDGRTAYVPEYNVIAELAVLADGTLSPSTYTRIPTVPSGTDVDAFALSPDRRAAYGANASDDTVSQYKVAFNGRLAPAGGPAVATGSAPGAIAVSPDGRNVYVANFADGTISVYAAAPSGALKLQATVASGDEPSSIALGFTLPTFF